MGWFERRCRSGRSSRNPSAGSWCGTSNRLAGLLLRGTLPYLNLDPVASASPALQGGVSEPYYNPLKTVRAIPDRLVYVMRHGIRTNKHLSFETSKSGLGKDCQGKGSFCCGTGTPNHRQGTRPWAKTKRVNH